MSTGEARGPEPATGFVREVNETSPEHAAFRADFVAEAVPSGHVAVPSGHVGRTEVVRRGIGSSGAPEPAAPEEPPDPPPPTPPREAAAVRDTVTRLRAAWPAIDEATVEAAVRAAYDSFRRARVTAYVPILAERQARRVLGAAGGGAPDGDGERNR